MGAEAVLGALGDATRRRILEALAGCELPAGAVVEAVQAQQAISQPAVSQHLKVLREAGLVTVQADGTRRRYAVDADALAQAVAWLEAVAQPMTPLEQPLDALATEVARGHRTRRRAGPGDAAATG